MVVNQKSVKEQCGKSRAERGAISGDAGADRDRRGAQMELGSSNAQKAQRVYNAYRFSKSKRKFRLKWQPQ